jgi:hypothetical protein
MLARLILAASVLLLAAPGQPVPPASAWAPRVDTTASPAGAASSVPQLTQSPRGVLLSWIERAGPRAALKFSEWSGGQWSQPRLVASGDNWFVNWADVPSVMRLPDGTLAAHWLQKSGSGTYAYDVQLSRSKDDGRTWSAPVRPHKDRTESEHGFASLIPLPGNALGLVWLDGRAMLGGHGAPAAKGTPAGAMGLRFARFDTAWKQVEETLVDGRVCECCPTAAAVTDEGPIIAFRNRTDTEVRDIHVARLVNGKWTASRPVHQDGWVINACPVNGPMLSARGRRVAAAWFTTRADKGHAYVAFSADSGERFSAPVQLDDEATLGRVDVELMTDGGAVASWIEVADQKAQFKVRRIDAAGSRSAAIAVADLAASRASGYPRLAAAGDDVVFAWTESSDGRSQVRTAVARAR